MSDSREAKKTANVLYSSLVSQPMGQMSLAVAMGVAAMPDDAQDLVELISGAKTALTAAQQGDSPICFYHEIRM